MKATIKTQGKQLTIEKGDIFKITRYPNTDKDNIIEINEVLMCEDASEVKIGNPFLKNASVKVRILENKKDKKVTILKHRRRGGFQRKQGFRQALSVVKVESIEVK